jgi:hypothetical protein
VNKRFSIRHLTFLICHLRGGAQSSIKTSPILDYEVNKEFEVAQIGQMTNERCQKRNDKCFVLG